jgi:hypothetical protein
VGTYGRYARRCQAHACVELKETVLVRAQEANPGNNAETALTYINWGSILNKPIMKIIAQWMASGSHSLYGHPILMTITLARLAR